MILAISLGNAFPWRCPILAQSEQRGHSDGRSGVSSGLVRRSPCFLPAGLSYVALSPDGAPGEGCLTEVCPVASGHTRWHNEVVHRGNHHYGEGRQRLRTPPPVVSRGPRERRCPLVRESCWLISCRKIRRAGVLGPARGLSWPARLSGGAAFLERTSRVTGMALTRGARSGGCHVSQEVGPRARSLSGEGCSPRRFSGLSRSRPSKFTGPPFTRVGPSGIPGLLPR